MIQYDYIGSQFLGIYRDSKGYCGPKYTKIKKRNNGCKKNIIQITSLHIFKDTLLFSYLLSVLSITFQNPFLISLSNSETLTTSDSTLDGTLFL